jgi:hypothetical protein
MGVKYDFLMVILVEFDTNIIEIGPPGLILWEKYYLMAAILENGRQWPPYRIFQVANTLFVISRPKVTCMHNLVLVSQCERLSHLSAPLMKPCTLHIIVFVYIWTVQYKRNWRDIESVKTDINVLVSLLYPLVSYCEKTTPKLAYTCFSPLLLSY